MYYLIEDNDICSTEEPTNPGTYTTDLCSESFSSKSRLTENAAVNGGDEIVKNSKISLPVKYLNSVLRVFYVPLTGRYII